MGDVTRILRAVEKLIGEMYDMGGADAMKNMEAIREDVRARGFDAGYEQGYNAAMAEFRVPDL